jgi:hypothetical protein
MAHNVFVYGFVALGTKLPKTKKPIVQHRGFSERKIRRNELYMLLVDVNGLY